MKDVALSSGSAWWDWTCQLVVVGSFVENVNIVFSTSASLEPSYVLRALGAEEDMAHSSIRSYALKLHLSTLTNICSSLFMHRKISHDSCVRFGIGRFTSEEEVGFSLSCQHMISRNNISRWGTLLRGLWRKCLDWETCLLSGIWSRCVFFYPLGFNILLCFFRMELIWRLSNGLNTNTKNISTQQNHLCTMTCHLSI